MRILVWDRQVAASARLAAILKDGGHQTVVASDEASMRAAFSGESVQLALVGAHGPDEALLPQLRVLRRIADSHGIMLALVGEELPVPYLSRAYEGGIDLDIPAAQGPALLLARLRGAERLWAHGDAAAPSSRPAAPPPASAPQPASEGAPPIERVGRSAAWRNMPTVLQVASSKFLTVAVGDPVPIEAAEVEHACEIVLSSTELELEVRLAVGADARSARILASNLFGDEGEELVADLLAELSNICMGAAKTCLGDGLFEFVGGLPAPIETRLLLAPAHAYRFQEAVRLGAGAANVILWRGLRSHANLDLTAADLREGMVLAKPVFNAHGVLMLPGGTRLSSNMIGKLVNILPPRTCVSVMAP